MSERKNPYEMIGGAAKIEELVDRFYDLMALEEPFDALRAIHPQDLSNSRDKLKLFLSGWLGGPDIDSEAWSPHVARSALTLQDWPQRA